MSLLHRYLPSEGRKTFVLSSLLALDGICLLMTLFCAAGLNEEWRWRLLDESHDQAVFQHGLAGKTCSWLSAF